MEEIDNFNFPTVRKHYMYELWGHVGRDLQNVPRSGIRSCSTQHRGILCRTIHFNKGRGKSTSSALDPVIRTC